LGSFALENTERDFQRDREMVWAYINPLLRDAVRDFRDVETGVID
jgi:hypothetical protein